MAPTTKNKHRERAARRLRRTKRERFLPYAHQRHGLILSLGEVRLDGRRVDDELVDADRHLVNLEATSWKRASIELCARYDEALLSQLLPEAERAQPPVAVLAAVRCEATRFRVGLLLSPIEGSGHQGTVQLRRDCLHRKTMLTAYLVRTRRAARSVPAFARAQGARLADARGWELRIEPPREADGKFLDIRYRSFSDDEVLKPFAGNLYRLEMDQPRPVLWVNADHQLITPVLGDRGTTGKRARLREVFYDLISQGVWTQLFLRTIDDLRGEGELSYDSERAVLSELLPAMYPKQRSNAARLAVLKSSLAADGLSLMAERLDAALQKKSAISAHMTRLVQETLDVADVAPRDET